MKIAILGDIHGNKHALEATLDDLKKQHVDRVIINGDSVNRGPHSVAVLEILFSEDFEFTLGNHDDLVCMWQAKDPKLPQNWQQDPFWRSTAMVARSLERAGYLEKLGQFPLAISIHTRQAPRVMITHGSPRHYREGYGTFTAASVFREIAAKYDAVVFVGSHTHRPLDYFHGDRRFLNTSAVGTPFNRKPDAQYLILEAKNAQWEVEFRHVPYDRQKAIDAFSETGFLEQGGLSAQIFRDELIHLRPLFDPFWQWTEKNTIPRNQTSWNIFKKRHLT